MVQIGVKRKEDSRDTSKKGGAGLSEEHGCAPPLYFGFDQKLHRYQADISTGG